MKKTTDPGSTKANRDGAVPASRSPSPRHESRNETAAAHRPTERNSLLTAPARSIELHIDELVLHGFSHTDRRPIADAIERELSALLAREGLPLDHSFEVAHLNGGSFRVAKTAQQESAGTSVARAIYGGLRR